MRFYFAETNNLRLKVTFDYSPGTSDVMYLPNGDPGYPGDPPELMIESVIVERKGSAGWWTTDIDLLGWLYEDDDETPLSQLSAAAIEAWEDEQIKLQAERDEHSFPEDV